MPKIKNPLPAIEDEGSATLALSSKTLHRGASQELAPAPFRAGCCGIIGPVPPPLSIRLLSSGKS